MMTRCMGALFSNSMAGDLNWNGKPREGVAKGKFGGSECQKLIHRNYYYSVFSLFSNLKP